MSYEYRRLDINKDGGVTLSLFGTEEVLRGAYDELKAACEAPDGVAPKTIEIHGHTDTPDRAETITFIKTDVVNSCTLIKMV